MKKIGLFVSLSMLVLAINEQAHAQFLKNLKDRVEQVQNGGAQKTQEDNSPVAPKNYNLKLTGSGTDLHLSYRMEMYRENTQGFQTDMNMEFYIVPEKGGRTEVNIEIPVMGTMSIVTLSHFDEPKKVYLLNEKKKQYAVIDIREEKKEHFTITRLGEEKLHGLPCMHGKASNKDGQVFEFWTTKGIPEYQKLMTVYSQSGRMGSHALWQEMTTTGTAGLMVKLLIPTPEGSVIMELTQMKKIDLPTSMLEIPSNYKESKGGWVKRYQKQM